MHVNVTVWSMPEMDLRVVSGLPPPKAAESTFVEGNPNVFSGEESANPVGESIQSRACVRKAAADFQLGVSANRKSPERGEKIETQLMTGSRCIRNGLWGDDQ